MVTGIPIDQWFKSTLRNMDFTEWTRKQEEIFAGGNFGVSTERVNKRPLHFFNLITGDTGVKKTDYILFLGCNDGGHMIEFMNMGYNKVYGCDLEGVINRAKPLKPRIAKNLFIVNLETTPLPRSHRWKLVVAKAIIEHLGTWAELPKKIAKVQSSGGLVWVCTNDGTKIPRPEARHFTHIPFDTLEHIFKDAGYSIVKHYDFEGPPHNGLMQFLTGRKE